jgi:hypothetical protein
LILFLSYPQFPVLNRSVLSRNLNFWFILSRFSIRDLPCLFSFSFKAGLILNSYTEVSLVLSVLAVPSTFDPCHFVLKQNCTQIMSVLSLPVNSHLANFGSFAGIKFLWWYCFLIFSSLKDHFQQQLILQASLFTIPS